MTRNLNFLYPPDFDSNWLFIQKHTSIVSPIASSKGIWIKKQPRSANAVPGASANHQSRLHQTSIPCSLPFLVLACHSSSTFSSLLLSSSCFYYVYSQFLVFTPMLLLLPARLTPNALEMPSTYSPLSTNEARPVFSPFKAILEWLMSSLQ